MVQNDRKWSKIMKMVNMVKLIQLVQHGKIGQNDPKKNDAKWSIMVLNGKKMVIIV